MKYEEYIKKLDVLDEEFEEGLLLELQEKPPTNLHGEIMKSVSRERRKVNFFNYRIYAPAVAAVLVFAVVINKPEILENLNFTKNVRITQGQYLRNNENTDPKDKNSQKEINNPDVSNDTNVAINTPKDQDPEATTPNNNTQSAPSDSNNATQQKDTKTNVNENNTPKVASEGNIGKTDTSPAEGDIAANNESEEKQLFMANYLGFLYFKEPDVNYEIVLDVNKSSILNFITENYEEKLNAPNTYKLSIEQFDSLDKLLINNNIGKKVINESAATTSKVVKINFVNYHITINDSKSDVVKFLEDQEKSVKIDDNTYKIALGNMSELDKIINSSGIKKEFISKADDEYIIFKTLIINYEITIDSSQTAAAVFFEG